MVPSGPDADQDQRAQLVRHHLTKADEIGPNDPKIRLFLAAEWMAYGEFDKVVTELDAADQLSDEEREERDFDLDTWVVDRFHAASELTLRTGNFAEDGEGGRRRPRPTGGTGPSPAPIRIQQVIRAAAVLTTMDSKGFKSEGVKRFEHAVQRWPHFPDARLGLASAFYQVGQARKAKQAYRALLNLGRVCARLGELDLAGVHIRRP